MNVIERWAAVLGLLAWCASCSLRSTVVASPSEYDSYRRVRLADDHADRLVWASRYLRHYPDGVFRAEVQQWFGPAQSRFMRWAWDDADRLGRFLALLPRGSYAELAAKRRATLLAHRQAAQQAQAQLLDRARQRQRRLDQAAAERRRFIERYKEWVRWAVQRAPYEQSQEQVVAALKTWGSERDSAQERAVRCEANACVARVLWGFPIPIAGRLEARGAPLQLRARLDESGRLRAVGLGAPRLLDRLAEAASLRAVAVDDAQARAEAIATGLTVSRAALDEVGIGPSCELTAVTPMVLHRQCHGRSVRVIAGEAVVEDDWVWVTPVAGSAGGAPPGTQ